jgi:unsaturated pyranuronate lyase
VPGAVRSDSIATSSQRSVAAGVKGTVRSCPMPFTRLDDLERRTLFPGFDARLVHTAHATLSFVEAEAGAAFPEHSHPHEQTVVVLDGELELVVQGTATHLTPGTAFVIPPDVPHSGRAVVATRVLDVFAPAREDYRA